ncbi:hypothetical protein GALL_507520 [mine drainage metagenome]|uniref:Uncharacterized protein n=1 Tax=mine drainage metagenome TaxID=410659 RepID=A0A1J5P8Y9_9ZZZZ
MGQQMRGTGGGSHRRQRRSGRGVLARFGGKANAGCGRRNSRGDRRRLPFGTGGWHGRRWSGLGLGRCRTACVRLELQQHHAFAHLVAQLHPQRLHHSRRAARYLHARLVALHRDQRLLHGNPVPGLHQNLDHLHILEIPYVGNLDLDDGHIVLPVRSAHAANRRATRRARW